MRKIYIFLWVMLLFLLGCGNAVTERAPVEDHSNHSQQTNRTGDIRETTPNVETLPSFLNQGNEHITGVYQLVGQNTELINQMPCYCGCGQTVGHESNRSCFINELKQDGSIVWDSHGMTCGVCLDIAVEAVHLKNQGQSEQKIRQYIDNKYSEGYSDPTPTPLPE